MQAVLVVSTMIFPGPSCRSVRSAATHPNPRAISGQGVDAIGVSWLIEIVGHASVRVGPFRNQVYSMMRLLLGPIDGVQTRAHGSSFTRF